MHAHLLCSHICQLFRTLTCCLQDKFLLRYKWNGASLFTQTGRSANQQGAWDHKDVNGYQLGGTLSSMFTILSLFTEDVKMSWQDNHPDSPFVTGSPLPESQGVLVVAPIQMSQL